MLTSSAAQQTTLIGPEPGHWQLKMIRPAEFKLEECRICVHQDKCIKQA